MVITDPGALTPVEEHEGILLKREDLFQPFGPDTVNGGKLRQCYYLIEDIKDKYSKVISCCSIHSPQAPITSAVAHHFGLKCEIYYGGTTPERLRKYRMADISMRYGAQLTIASKSGIHKILYHKARKLADENHWFVVDYGFNLTDKRDLLLNAVSKQVQNIPDELDNLVITCGSGITTSGVLIGLKQYRKKVKDIYLVCTAPNRTELIQKNVGNIPFAVHRIDLFHQPGFKYENGLIEYIDGIKLHPNYEAKTYNWLKRADLKGKTLLWIVGSKPMR